MRVVEKEIFFVFAAHSMSTRQRFRAWYKCHGCGVPQETFDPTSSAQIVCVDCAFCPTSPAIMRALLTPCECHPRSSAFSAGCSRLSTVKSLVEAHSNVELDKFVVLGIAIQSGGLFCDHQLVQFLVRNCGLVISDTARLGVLYNVTHNVASNSLLDVHRMSLPIIQFLVEYGVVDPRQVDQLYNTRQHARLVLERPWKAIDLCPGDMVDVLDLAGHQIWRRGIVRATKSHLSTRYYRVQYADGWRSLYDEWIQVDSLDLAAPMSRAERLTMHCWGTCMYDRLSALWHSDTADEPWQRNERLLHPYHRQDQKNAARVLLNAFDSALERRSNAHKQFVRVILEACPTMLPCLANIVLDYVRYYGLVS